MALFYVLLKKDPVCPIKLMTMFSDNEETRYLERKAAIKIQSWYRSVQTQKQIRYLHSCALLIQKTYRGYVGRQLYRQHVQNKMKTIKKKFYDVMATKIQSRWRGFYARKYKLNFYARKEYLIALAQKNEILRANLRSIADNVSLEKQKLETQEIKEKEKLKNRQTHYLLSTRVCSGIYNSPKRKKKSNMKKEATLRKLKPLSNLERELIRQTQRANYLRSATGIPNEYDDCPENEFAPMKMLLPPLNTTKPQGPFNEPFDVQSQRYKKLQPTLRVATEYQSIDRARTSLHQEEWTKRVIDQKFLPVTKQRYSYSASLNASSAYGRLDYGTKHFRASHSHKNIHTKPFQRVVSPIPLFENMQQQKT